MSGGREKIERWLQVNLAAVVALGATLLGMGQRDMRLAVLAWLAAAASLVVTDLKGWIRLNRNLANVAALVAVGFSVVDFIRFETDSQLLAIANLLVYLQVVLLFQEKTARLYWQILVLSLLQVVVGAALNLGVGFGALLVVYLYLALTSLVLMFAKGEVARHDRPASASEPSTAPGVPSNGRPPAREAPTNRPIVLLPAGADQLALQLLHCGVPGLGLRICLGALLVAVGVFFGIPRYGKTIWEPLAGSVQRMSGFSNTVSLGALGQIADNAELVMRVEFRTRGDRPYKIVGEPLFRGSTKNIYSQGEWQFLASPPRDVRARRRAPLDPHVPADAEAVLQRISIEPMDEPVVFGVYPMYHADPFQLDSTIRFDRAMHQLIRDENRQYSGMIYETYTTGLSHGLQQRVVPNPANPPLSDREMNFLLQLPYNRVTLNASASLEEATLRKDAIAANEDLSGLVAAAQQQIDAAGIARSDPHFRIQAARELEQYLLSSRFTYTLTPQPRDPALDPIEDFIRNNPRGHCEYFATALVLMLRSQGIPARIVIGFKGGDYNQLGAFYQVRQLHAHAWVEAYLEPSQVPQEERPEGYPADMPCWLILDPTPAAAAASDYSDSEWLNSLADFGDYLQLLWSNYVVGLNAERQQATIYRPFFEVPEGMSAYSYLKDRLRAAWREARAWIGGDWFSWKGGLAAAGLAALVASLVWTVRTLYRRWPRRRAIRKARRRHADERIEFYMRLENLLRRRGVVRLPGQTPLEFAQQAAAELIGFGAPRPVTTIPRRVVEEYYRVRYGGRALDRAEQQALEQQLGELEATLKRAATRPV